MKREFIISANYFDRDDTEFPFLVRKQGEPLDKAVKVRTVDATNILVCPASTEEKGFGCGIVVFAKSVITDPPMPMVGIPVSFRGDSFKVKDSYEEINEAKSAHFEKGNTLFVV